MAYRERPVDPRVAELAAVIATEAPLRKELATVQRAIDELQAQLTELAPKYADAEDTLTHRREGGVLATIGNLIGRSADHLEAITAEHAMLRDQLAAHQATEQQLHARIVVAFRARTDLAGLRERAIAALRVELGPVRDEVLALDAEDDRARRRAAVIAHVLGLVEEARAAIVGIQQAAEELSNRERASEHLDSWSVWPLGGSPAAEAEQQARVRLSDAIADAVGRITSLCNDYGDTRCAWTAAISAEQLAQLFRPIRHLDSIETYLSVTQLRELIECFAALEGELTTAADRLAAETAERDDRRAQLAGLS